MPLVCGDLGEVSRYLIPRVDQSVLNAGCRVAARLRTPKRRSVNALPLSVKMVRIRIGRARSRSPKKRRALAAVLLRRVPMKTYQLAMSIATR